MKLRFILHAADQRLAESYRALGKYGLMKLEMKLPDFVKDPEWTQRIREVEAWRAEREKLAAEHACLWSGKREKPRAVKSRGVIAGVLK